jgi:hypothetical protein
MRHFQILVLLMLLTIAAELAVIAVKLPGNPAFAQARTPIPVVINNGILSPGCVSFGCAKVGADGSLQVSTP